jgi:ATP-dependent Clp protease ATP-binding subunit ClpB
VDQGYDPVFGARPLKRVLQSKVETLLAKKIIAGDIAPRSTITVDYDGHELVTTTAINADVIS